MAMTLRLPDELVERVRKQAEGEHISMQNLVVKATEEYVGRRSKRARILAAVDGIKVDYAEALKRLGE
jgi:predicted transcriptional regulator